MKKQLQPKMLLQLKKKHRKLKKEKRSKIMLLRVVINSFNSLMKKKDEKVSQMELLVCNTKLRKVKWQTLKVPTSFRMLTRRKIAISRITSRRMVKRNLIVQEVLPLRRRSLRILKNLMLKLRRSSSLKQRHQ